MGSSWVVVGEVVLVEDRVARPEILLYPLDGIFSRVDQDDGDAALGRAAAEGGLVGLADDDEVGRAARGHRGGGAGVLLGLAGPELHHAGRDDDPLAIARRSSGLPFEG